MPTNKLLHSSFAINRVLVTAATSSWKKTFSHTNRLKKKNLSKTIKMKFHWKSSPYVKYNIFSRMGEPKKDLNQFSVFSFFYAYNFVFCYLFQVFSTFNVLILNTIHNWFDLLKLFSPGTKEMYQLKAL